MESVTFTIGHLARRAGVGVETVRYYQQRKLLPVPAKNGAYRRYPAHLADSIRFIKRAQELGFSLDEIAQLLSLHDGGNRISIRNLAAARLREIESKLADLQRMKGALRHLVDECEHTGADQPCPIIASLARGDEIVSA
jgi:Hg(II)-responsive transcriptional regulator